LKLKLHRIQLAADFTIGRLLIDDMPECYICEDAVREFPGLPVASWKIYGKTAIPYGTYQIDITLSARFGRMLPLLIGVPGFDGIRIHPGNKAVNTDGCLLPGFDRLPDGVGKSVLAFNALMPKLSAALSAGDKITIEVA
jgi:hypothetical protein